MPALCACLLLIPSAMFANDASSWTVPNPRAPKGTVRELRAPERANLAGRRVWLYTPPGYDPARGAPYDLIVAFDGEAYVSDIPLPTILDNLQAAGKIPPTVSVLIDNGAGSARLADLANRASFAAFMADELVPWIRGKWHVTRDPRRTIVTGSSAGGLGAAYLALKHPELFGNVLAQSPAVWRGAEASNDAPYEWLAAQYKGAPKLPVAFFVEVGALETHRVLGGSGPAFIEATRRFRDVLVAKGYTLEYAEIPGAQHEPGHWRDHLADGIVWLASRMPAP